MILLELIYPGFLVLRIFNDIDICLRFYPHVFVRVLVINLFNNAFNDLDSFSQVCSEVFWSRDAGTSTWKCRSITCWVSRGFWSAFRDRRKLVVFGLVWSTAAWFVWRMSRLFLAGSVLQHERFQWNDIYGRRLVLGQILIDMYGDRHFMNFYSYHVQERDTSGRLRGRFVLNQWPRGVNDKF